MKTKLSFFAFCFILCNISISAQITYDGYMLNIGGAAANGKFNFAINNLSGLYWTYDTSKFLQWDLTSGNPRLAGTGNQIAFYNTFTSTFNSIQVADIYNYSDQRAKTNIKTLDSGLNTILNLRPVSYNWKKDDKTANSVSVASEESTPNSFGPNAGDKRQYGFLAQEVEKVLPDAVATDDKGNKLINYTAIIPHLVQSIQELQAVVARQATEIENLSASQSGSSVAASADKIVNCTPNPSPGMVTFEYTLYDASSAAIIYVSDLTGNLKQTINCTANATSVSEDLSSLRDGIYIATLSVNGNVKDSKQFIIRK